MKVEDLIPKEFHNFIPTVFSECPIGVLPTRKPYDHAINLKPDFNPVIQKPFRLDQKQNEAVRTFIQENLDKGFIRPSYSPQTSVLFFVPKEDGKPCPIQDYHYLNSQTIRNGYPLPRIDELIDNLREYDCFIKMVIRWGYNNVRIKEEDEWKVAFSCREGSFEPLVMFFGLTNTPATFQAMMNDIFAQELIQRWLKIYMDDLLICGRKSELKELIARTQKILQKCQENDLFVKPDKCDFFVSTVEFLGFMIREGKLEMNPAKLDGIASWPPPENVKQLWSFLGFCNFYRRFIDHYADKTVALNMLLCKTHPWEWTTVQHSACEILKTAFCSKPVLLMPDYTKPFEIESDASLYATGAILLQQDTNGDWHPVAYCSQSMNPMERNYQVYDRELMAIICLLREW